MCSDRCATVDLHAPLSDPAFARRHYAKLVWLYVVPSWPAHEERMIKVRPVAELFGAHPKRVRDAVRILVRAQYLELVQSPTRGTAGVYRIGPRALRRVTSHAPLSRVA